VVDETNDFDPEIRARLVQASESDFNQSTATSNFTRPLTYRGTSARFQCAFSERLQNKITQGLSPKGLGLFARLSLETGEVSCRRSFCCLLHVGNGTNVLSQLARRCYSTLRGKSVVAPALTRFTARVREKSRTIKGSTAVRFQVIASTASLARHKGLLKAELQSSLRVGNLLIWCEKLNVFCFKRFPNPAVVRNRHFSAQSLQ